MHTKTIISGIMAISKTHDSVSIWILKTGNYSIDHDFESLMVLNKQTKLPHTSYHMGFMRCIVTYHVGWSPMNSSTWNHTWLGIAWFQVLTFALQGKVCRQHKWTGNLMMNDGWVIIDKDWWWSLTADGYPSSHTHGSGKWVPPIVVTFELG